MIPFREGSRVGYIVDETTGCWLWKGATAPNGYGRVGVAGTHRVVQAHRAMYERANGPVPAGVDLDHLCRVRHCVNPAHLEPVDRKTNARRGAKPKITIEIAREIRRRYAAGGITQRELAADYGIAHPQISLIVHMKRWAE